IKGALLALDRRRPVEANARQVQVVATCKDGDSIGGLSSACVSGTGAIAAARSTMDVANVVLLRRARKATVSLNM
ncbi:hypothetical protein CPB85DRAFT_1307434, partial [Mucidula mucida]